MSRLGAFGLILVLIATSYVAVSGCRAPSSRLNTTEAAGSPSGAADANAERGSPAASPDRADSQERTAEAERSTPGFLGEDQLSDHGLANLWTKQRTAEEGAIRSAYLLPEGIFAVTRPQGETRVWRLVCYNHETGLPRWFYNLDEPLEFAPVAYRYGQSTEGRRPDELYILQKDVIRCLDLQYGAEMWRVGLPFPVSCGPLVDEKQYYLGSYDRRIYAMGKDKKYESWTYITGGEIKSPGTIGAGGELYFASTDRSLYRLEPTGGRMQGRSWGFPTGGRILGSPVFFSRWVFTGSTDFKLYCLEVDGARAWEFPTEAPILDTPVVLSVRPDKMIAVTVSQDERRGSEKRVAWAVDARTGKELWHREHVQQAVGLGKTALYLMPDMRPGRAGGARRIIAVDALKGDELFALPLPGFDFVLQNEASNGTNQKARGVLYLVSKTGMMQAIREKP